MNHYSWQGINHKGNQLSGIREAATVAVLKEDLVRQGIFVRKIRRANPLFGRAKLRQNNLTLFFRQLATMLKAGIPLTQSFEIVANSQANFTLRSLIGDLKKEVESGQPFSTALQQRPHYFNRLVCNLIACGEKAGKLDLMLDKVAIYKEGIAKVQQRLQKALTYPLIVLVIAFFITLALLLFVVPQFQSLFMSFGAELPLLTRSMIALAAFVNSYCLLLFIILGFIIFGIIQARHYLPWFRFACDSLILKLPLTSKAMIARFAQTLAICFNAGLPIVEALDAVKGVSTNQLYIRAMNIIREEVFNGQPMHHAMAKSRLFPSLALELTRIGEESGTLELMLVKIAEYYEEELNIRLDILMNLLEPLIMVILGLIIGSLVIAMYLPVFKLGSVV